MIKAVIFDMDGTLYDTEAIYKKAWLKAGVANEIYQKLIGRSRVNIKAILKENGYDPEEIYKLKDKYTEEEISKKIPLKPGAESALKWCKEKNFYTAIATSSAKEVADRYLSQTGLDKYMDKVISGNMLEHGKPAPDIFIYAAGQLGVEVSECVVVEDSINGVKAGRNANMITVMIPDLVEPDREAKKDADVILKSLNELPNFIDGIDS